MVPAGPVTEIGPVAALVGTTAEIVPFGRLVNEAAFKPLNCTAVAPTKFVPEMMTFVPGKPFVGTKPLTTGAP